MEHELTFVLAICVMLVVALVVMGCASPPREYLDKGDAYFEQGQ